MEILFISRVTIWSVFQNPVTYMECKGLVDEALFHGCSTVH